jgi:hypothetical protein
MPEQPSERSSRAVRVDLCGPARDGRRPSARPFARWLELGGIFFVLPTLFAFQLPRRSALLLPGLWVLAAVCYALCRRDRTFDRRVLWRFDVTPRRLIHMGLRFVLAVTAMALVTRHLLPSAWLYLPRQEPAMWLLVVAAYPLLSALPQGFVWRVFFVHRYAGLWRDQRCSLAAGAFCFAFAHVIFGNAIAVLAAAIGGALFLETYLATRSMWLATIEHALYGLAAFTLGLGQFLYMEALPRL